MTTVRGAVSFTALLLLLAASCGGGGGSSQPGRSADDEDFSTEGGDGDESSAGDADGEEEPAAKRIDCDDGTCSPCGEGLCLSGWYCDESAKGGPACGWLPECANKLSCSCLKKTFANCSCEEKDGGVHLSCN